MHGPDGSDYPNKSVFLEVVNPEHGLLACRGQTGRSGVNFQFTFRFEEEGDKTRLTLRMVFDTAQDRERIAKEFGAIEGGKQTLERLAGYLSNPSVIAELGKLTTILSRVFDAPRKLVYEAYTNPIHVSHWWGLPTLKATVDKMEVRPGVARRFVQRGPDGKEHAFRGEHCEIVSPERIVSTFEYEAMPERVIVNTATFEEHEGRTKVTVTSVYQSVEERDGMIRSGMERGANESWDMLEELLPKMSAGKNSQSTV